MMQKVPEHRPTRLPVSLASTLSKLYKLGIDHQNRKYDRGIGVTRFDRPVISIGNLSTGGTGKTPLVRHVVATLLGAGHHPVIAMRGYKSKPNQLSDEQIEHAEAFPGVPIVAQPDRSAGLRSLFETQEGESIDCIVLDDGFQHRKIARDLDIVLIDASRPPSTDALLPLGYLREQPSNISRADCVVISHAERVDESSVDDLRRWIGRAAPGVGIVVTEHRWSRIDRYEYQQKEPSPSTTDSLDTLPIAVLTAIGNPGAMVDTAMRAGAQIVHRLDRPDHDPFSNAVLAGFVEQAHASGACGILTSAKDWTKLKSRFGGANPMTTLPVLVPRLELEFRDGRSGFDTRCIHIF